MMPRAVPWVFTLLLAAAVFPPFVGLSGPLSVDDLLPLAAAGIGTGCLLFQRRPPAFDATVIGFALLVLVSLTSSAANAESLSDFARLAGRSAGRNTFFLMLIVGARAVLDRDDWPRKALLLVAGAATIEALFCIYAFLTNYQGPYGMGVVGFAHWSVLVGKTRVQGTFGGDMLHYESIPVSSNFLAAYLVLSIPMTIGLVAMVRRWWWRAALIVAGLLQIVTLYLTYTRAALAAFGVASLAMGFLSGRKKLAMTVLGIGVAFALSVPTVRAKILGEGHDRWALYWASGTITAHHAVFGIGDGNYEVLLHENQHYHETPFGIATATSHNSILLSAANYGVPGGAAHALLYLLALAAMLRELSRVRDPRSRVAVAGVIAGIIGYLAQDQFNNLAYIPKVATQMWFLYALVQPLARHSSWTEQNAPTIEAPVS